MVSANKACEIATEFHNEPFVDAITDIGHGYVVGTVAEDGEVSDTPPVYVPKAGGKAEFLFIPDHFEEIKNGETLEIPEKYKFNQ